MAEREVDDGVVGPVLSAVEVVLAERCQADIVAGQRAQRFCAAALLRQDTHEEILLMRPLLPSARQPAAAPG